MDKMIKKLISEGNIEILQELELDENNDLYKIAKTVPLTAEQIYLQHGIEESIKYIDICNEVDGERVELELEDYLAKNKLPSEEGWKNKTSIKDELNFQV